SNTNGLNFGSDSLVSFSQSQTVYTYDGNNHRVDGVTTSHTQRYDYDPLSGPDTSVILETNDAVTGETYQQIQIHPPFISEPFTVTRRTQVHTVSDQSSLDTAFTHQDITNYYAFENVYGEVVDQADMNSDGQ